MLEIGNNVHTVTYFKGLPGEPVVSSPYLTRVVLRRGNDGVAGVVERAGKHFPIVPGQCLGAGTGARIPNAGRFVGRCRQQQSTRWAERHLGHFVRMAGHDRNELEVARNVPHLGGTVGTARR